MQSYDLAETKSILINNFNNIFLVNIYKHKVCYNKDRKDEVLAAMTERKLLLIHSHDRTGGTTTNFTVPLGGYLNRVYSLALASADMPNSFYNVSTYNNILQLRHYTNQNDANPVNTYNIAVAVGAYSVVAFAAALQSAINAATGQDYTVVANTLTKKFTITCVGVWFNFNVTNSSMRDIIGCKTNSAPTHILISDSLYDFRGVTTAFIYVSGNLQPFTINQVGRLENILGKVQITSGFGTTVYYKASTELEKFNFAPTNISTLNVSIRDVDGRILDNNNMDITMSIIVDMYK